MDFLGTNLPFNKVEYLLESPFNLEVDRIYHLKRYCYDPLILHKAVKSNYFGEFIRLFDLDTMTNSQVLHGVEWLTVLCKETSTAVTIKKLPLEKLIQHAVYKIQVKSLELLRRTILLLCHPSDTVPFTARIQPILLSLLYSFPSKKEYNSKNLSTTLECLSLLDFGQDPYCSDFDSSLKILEDLKIYLVDDAPKEFKRHAMKYLRKIFYFRNNRALLFESSLLDLILQMKENLVELNELKEIISLDYRIKKLVE